MRVPLFQFDTFADEVFAGNPAAVALFESPQPDSLLQQIAGEMNLSETAFPIRRSDGDWDLRWFTPTAEVDMCGHATLASAACLADQGLVDTNSSGSARVVFHTRSGPLTCEVSRSAPGSAIRVEMDFPASHAEPVEQAAEVAQALGCEVVAVGRSFDLIAELESPEAVRDLTPDLAAVAELDTRAVVITAAGDVDGGAADFVSRVFGPRVGIPEDPVTGSAHTILATWWADRLGTAELLAHQVSRRGGHLGLELHSDRVKITGSAVKVLEGVLHF